MSGEYDDLKRRMDGAIAAFKHDLASLRTGRASSNLLDAIQVQAYGTTMPINQVANVTVPEPRMISVSIWDKSMVARSTAPSENPTWASTRSSTVPI